MINILNLRDYPEHLPSLARWHESEWAYLNPGSNINKRITKMQLFLNEDFIPSTYIALDDELLGSAALVENDMETNPQLSPWLASVFVTEQHRCRGVGTQLIRHVMQQARQAGINSLYLFTPDKADFYQKLGWKILKTELYHGQEVTIMEARLNNINGQVV